MITTEQQHLTNVAVTSPASTTSSSSSASPKMESTTHHRQPLKFSVENILDPNKFTGQPSLVSIPSRNNNIFQHHHLFGNPHHPWLLPVHPNGLLHHHNIDLHSTSVESVNEEDSLYDRSDLESG